MHRYTYLLFTVVVGAVLLVIWHVTRQHEVHLLRGNLGISNTNLAHLSLLSVQRHFVQRHLVRIYSLVFTCSNMLDISNHFPSGQERKFLFHAVDVRVVHHVFRSSCIDPTAGAHLPIQRHRGAKFVLFVLPGISKSGKDILLVYDE